MKIHTLWACAVVSLTITHATNAQTTRYVNGACGDDSWSGTQEACAAPDGPTRTIQAAIVAAATGDTVIVADGVYTGADNRDLDFDGKDLTLRSANGSAACVIDCEEQSRFIFLYPEEVVHTTVQGFTLRNGRASDHYGGGIYVKHCVMTVLDCVFEHNSAIDSGGGFYARESTVTLRGCTFRNNTASVAGGVMLRFSTIATLVNCRFEDNSALAGGVGGLFIFSDSVADIVNCTFVRSNGGVGGGGAWFDGSAVNAVNCAFSRNVAGMGGGLALTSSSTVMVNSSFSQNIVSGVAGIGETGGGILVGNAAGNDVTLANSILWHNVPDQLDSPVQTSIANNIEDEPASPGDPLFVQPGSDDLRLAIGSPSIDLGDASLLPPDTHDLDNDGDTSEPIPFDLAGMPRVSGAALDQGAYEGEFDPEAPADEDEDWDNGEIIFLIPPGTPFNPPLATTVVATNVAGPDDALASATEIDWDLHPGAGRYSELGLIITFETSLPDSQHFSRVFIPMSAAPLAPGNPSAIDLTAFDPATGNWGLAVERNTQDSPGHSGPIGDRFYMENPDNDWGLTQDLGDYGVYWNPDLQRGFAWANVDFQGDFGFGEPICPGDCNLDGLVDPLDIAAVLAEWGPTTGSLCDLDNDFTVGPDDLAIVLGSWGECDGAPPMPSGPNTALPSFGRAVDAQNAWRDLNADNRFDAADIATILGHWGKVTEDRARAADLNGDHTVDRIDLDLLLDR